MSQRQAEFVTGAVSFDGLPDEGPPHVAIMGRSNVGKSSLINYLLNRRSLAQTSRKPGKTRQLNVYRVDGDFYLIDLPGFGYARFSRAERDRLQALITHYLTEHPRLVLGIHLVDARVGPTPIDHRTMDIMAGSQAEYAVVLTKIDKAKQAERHRAHQATLEALARRGIEAPMVATSSVKRRGAEQVWRLIDEVLQQRSR